MTTSAIQRSFAGGELSPSLAARADVPKYQTALRACRNFIVQRHGGVANRPGTRFVEATKTTATRQQFMRYVSEVSGESVLIECGHLYFRFFLNGAAITVAGVVAWNGATAYVAGDLASRLGVNYYCILAHTNQQPPNATYWYAMPAGDLYEIPHPFPAPGLCRWEQQGSVITLTHADIAPQELRFNDFTSWTVVPVVTGPTIQPPQDLTGTGSGGDNNRKFDYVVTAGDAETYEESEASTPWPVFREIGPRVNEPFSLEWTPSAGAAEYYIYCDPFRNGIYGFLATAVWDGTGGLGAFQFHDIGFPPDFSQSPPLPVRLFDAVGEYPAMAAYFQQRRFFANSRLEPEVIWGSRIGFPRNFGISSPLQDDDAVTFRLAGVQRHPVQHLIGLGPLIVLTDRGEWVIQGGGDGPLIPTSIQADQFGYWGASPAVPVVVGKSIIYVQARGRIVRDLQLDANVNGLNGRDLTLFAGHLFDGYTISKLDFAQNPQSVVWAVRSDGLLLGLTYVPDDDIWGWHRHDTGAAGSVLDVCVVPEADEDAVYLLVNRTIDGGAVRYIERMASRLFLVLEDAFFVDAGLSYDGAPITVVSGLDHLEGEVVAVLGDGVVVFNGDPAAAGAATFTVTAGSITLPAARSVIHVGLAIRHAEIELLDLDAPGTSVRDKRKRPQSVTLLVERSTRVFQAGPDTAHLVDYRPAPWEAAAGLVNDALEVIIKADWTHHGRIVVRQNNPLPLTVLGAIPNLDIGG
jgi:hypothetical protein